jgi:hypothetical protein
MGFAIVWMEETDSFQYSHTSKFVLIFINQRSSLMGMSVKVYKNRWLSLSKPPLSEFNFQPVGTPSTNKQLNISKNKQTQWTFLRYSLKPVSKKLLEVSYSIIQSQIQFEFQHNNTERRSKRETPRYRILWALLMFEWRKRRVFNTAIRVDLF